MNTDDISMGDKMTTGEPVVIFTVKDMLSDINRKLDEMRGSFAARLDSLEAWKRTVETTQQSQEESRESIHSRKADRRAFITTIASIVLAIAAIVTIFVSVHP